MEKCLLLGRKAAMRRYLLITIFIIVSMFLVIEPLIAFEPVINQEITEDVSNIEADNIYINNTKKEIEAVGNVRLTNQSLKIKADRLVFNYREKTINAYGQPILFEYKDRLFNGEKLQLNYKKEVVYLYKAEVKVKKFTFSGSEIEYFHNDIPNFIIKDAYYTTCEMEKPHYHYTAKKITYYPDDRIVGKDISFWWRDKKIVNLPSFIINITTDEEGKTVVGNNFPIPEFGYNGGEGFFIKINYPYEFNDKNNGRLYFLKESMGGFQINLNHNYVIDMDKKIFLLYNGEKYIDKEISEEVKSYQLGFKHKVNNNFKYSLYLEGYDKFKYVDVVENVSSINLESTYLTKKFALNAESKYDLNKKEMITQSYILNREAESSNLIIKYIKGNNTDYLPYGKFNYKFNKALSFGLGYGYIKENNFTQHKLDYILNYNKGIIINRSLDFSFDQNIKHISYLEEKSTATNYQSSIFMNINKTFFGLLSLAQSTGYVIKYNEGYPLFNIDEIKKDKKVVSNTELDFYYPKDKEHWKLALHLEYSLLEEKFQQRQVVLSHQYDCYGYQINYDLHNKSLGFQFNFIN